MGIVKTAYSSSQGCDVNAGENVILAGGISEYMEPHEAQMRSKCHKYTSMKCLIRQSHHRTWASPKKAKYDNLPYTLSRATRVASNNCPNSALRWSCNTYFSGCIVAIERLIWGILMFGVFIGGFTLGLGLEAWRWGDAEDAIWVRCVGVGCFFGMQRMLFTGFRLVLDMGCFFGCRMDAIYWGFKHVGHKLVF